MAFKMSLAINNDTGNIPIKKIFPQGLVQCLQTEKKENINFEQYARINLDGSKIAICETVSNTVFVRIFLSQRNTIIFALQLMKLVKLSTK